MRGHLLRHRCGRIDQPENGIETDCHFTGIATDRALHHFAVQLASTGSLPAQLTFNPEDRTSGNGSLMRLCPAPLLSLHLPAEDVVALARATSMPTHASRLCQDSCALFALYIYHLVRSTAPTPAERKRAVLDPNFIMLALHPEVDAIRRGFGWRGKKRDEISTSGFVLDTLRAALWGLDTFHSFEEGMMHLLGMGSDVDTVRSRPAEHSAVVGDSLLMVPSSVGLCCVRANCWSLLRR